MAPKRTSSAAATSASKNAKGGKAAAKPATKPAAKPAAKPASKTGGAKGALKKAAEKVEEVVDNAGDLLIDDVSEPATETEPRGKKRKTAEDFIESAENTVSSAASKVVKAIRGESDKAEPASSKTKGKAPAAAKESGRVTRSSKKGKKEPTPEPEEEDEAMDEDEESFIGAFSSDDDEDGADSSDDESDLEDVAVREAGKKIEISSIPHAKDDKSVAARLKKASKKKDVERGTIFLSRVPHGFYEEQMKDYFNQFGDVTRLRLARNPKTGASRHYAYIEFSSEPVAEIVADTMHNYLLLGHILQCEVIPRDEVHPQLWVGANKKFRKVPRARLEKVRIDKPRTKEEQAKANARVLKKQDERRAKIKAAGIDYTFEGH